MEMSYCDTSSHALFGQDSLFEIFCASIGIFGLPFLFLWRMSWDFDEYYIEYVDCFQKYSHFYNINSMIHENGKFFSLLMPQFLSYFIVFIVKSFLSLVRFIKSISLFFFLRLMWMRFFSPDFSARLFLMCRKATDCFMLI
jgi:hypothetical protein